MAVGLNAPENLLAVNGVKWSTANAGFKQQERHDLAVMEIAPGSAFGAVFTKNAFCAAPVYLAKQALETHSPRYLVINSGNANAGTGLAGEQLVRDVCAYVAEKQSVESTEVMVSSTGVIGVLPALSCYKSGFDAAVDGLSESGWDQASRAIMTTDTVAKGLSVQCSVGGKTVTVTGIAKGSGMIRPNMATMLAYIATDAGIDQAQLNQWLAKLTEASFNRVTVDGDMSTNDTCALVATGASGVDVAALNADDQSVVFDSLQKVFYFLAQALIRDGEGATKFVEIQANGGQSVQECLAVAYQIAHSPLVKTALFASDPNWGRILAAVGSAGVDGLDVAKLQIYIDDVLLCCDGGVAPGYTEIAGQRIFDKSEILIRVELNRGSVNETVWTSDLSYDYVKINAEYRT